MMKKFKLTHLQTDHILDMPLKRLTALEKRKLEEEQAELKKARADAIRTLGDGIATDIKTLRNLALTANKADDAETLKTMRAKLVKLHRAVVKELPAE